MNIKALIDPKSLISQLSLHHGRKRKVSEITLILQSNENLPKQSLEKKWTKAKNALITRH